MYSPTVKAVATQGIGRNVEIFDRLRRWAYTAVADWKIGTRECWAKVVSERAAQIAGAVGADSPRGPLPENEVGHIAKSVSRWVWERYTAGSPPLLREEQLARRRASERVRQSAREAERVRSKQTRAEYLARAQQRRTEAAQLRSRGMSLRAIGRALACSGAEVHRLLLSVQGPPAQSDFEGVRRSEASPPDGRSGDPVPLFSKTVVPVASSETVFSLQFRAPRERRRDRPGPTTDDVPNESRITAESNGDVCLPSSPPGTIDCTARAGDRCGASDRGDCVDEKSYESLLGFIQRRIREIQAERTDRDPPE
jgi:hypothetical protein